MFGPFLVWRLSAILCKIGQLFNHLVTLSRMSRFKTSQTTRPWCFYKICQLLLMKFGMKMILFRTDNFCCKNPSVGKFKIAIVNCPISQGLCWLNELHAKKLFQFFKPAANTIKLFTGVIFAVCYNLECLPLSVTSHIVKYLRAKLGAYQDSILIVGS